MMSRTGCNPRLLGALVVGCVVSFLFTSVLDGNKLNKPVVLTPRMVKEQLLARIRNGTPIKLDLNRHGGPARTPHPALSVPSRTAIPQRRDNTSARVETNLPLPPPPPPTSIPATPAPPFVYSERYNKIFALEPDQQKHILQNYDCHRENTDNILIKAEPSRVDGLGKNTWLHSLLCVEQKSYRTTGEEGVLWALLSVLGVDSSVYLELHAGGGWDALTRFLGDKSWKGILFDETEEDEAIGLFAEIVAVDTIADLMVKYNIPLNLDVLVLGSGCFDYWILRNILQAKYTPRVLAVNVNSKWMTDTSISVPHPALIEFGAESGRCGMTDWFGASVQAYATLADCFGYQLVYCESSGTTCFFARSDLLDFEDTEKAKSVLSAVNMWKSPEYGIPTGGFPTDHQGRPFLLIRSCLDIREPESAHVLTQTEAQYLARQAARPHRTIKVPFFSDPVVTPLSVGDTIKQNSVPAPRDVKIYCENNYPAATSKTLPQFTLCLKRGDEVSDYFKHHGSWMDCSALNVYVDIVKMATKATTALVVEVGGHIGVCTMELASREHDVVVFEANPTYNGLLEESKLLNKFDNIQLHKRSVGRGRNATEEERLARPQQETSLDEVVTTHVHFLKLNNHGYEHEALLGAQDLLERNSIDVIRTNFHPQMLSRSGHSGTEFLQFLEAANFNLLHKGVVLASSEFESFTRTVLEGVGAVDVFAVHKGNVPEKFHAQFR